MAGGKPSRSGAALITLVVIALIGIFIWWCATHDDGGTPEATDKEKERGGRAVTILAVNDIYRIDGVGAEEAGGLHRLRTLRKKLDKDLGNVLLLHAGDFLSPALEGRVFKGEQMVDALNNLDGDAKKFDARMFVTFGNHEFDDSDCNKSPAPLIARLNEFQFTWLNANLDFSGCLSMKDVAAHKNVKRTAVVELGGIKIGVFGIGLTPDPANARKYPRSGDIYEAARGAIKELKDKKAGVIIGLTHLERADDELLLRSLSEYGLDMIVGGHEHERMTIPDAKGVVRGFKSDSDAKTAREITVRMPAKGGRAIIVDKKLWELKDGVVEPDKDMTKLATKWAQQAEARICADRRKADREPNGPGCLQTQAGAAQFPIALEESDNRTTETEFGRWIAEAVRKATGADVAIIGAGSLGLNTNLAKGTMLRLEQVVDIFRFDDIVAVRSAKQADVCDAIRHAFAKPGNGAWPHVGGLKAAGNAATPAEILKKWQGTITRDDGAAFACDETMVKVASSPYLLCGGDGYPVMVDKGEAGDKCVEALKSKPGDRAKYPEGRYISTIAEQTIKHDKGLVMPPDPGE